MLDLFFKDLPEPPTIPHLEYSDAVTAKPLTDAPENYYDSGDVIKLYKHIEEEDWKAVKTFLETGTWPGAFFADAIAPPDQVRTWVTRIQGLKVLWSQLPLHAALVVAAPDDVIVLMVDMYPTAVKCTDSRGLLPFHLALQHGASDVVMDLLLHTFQDAVRVSAGTQPVLQTVLKGKNRPRGRLIHALCTETARKTTKEISEKFASELVGLQMQAHRKETELQHLRARAAALEEQAGIAPGAPVPIVQEEKKEDEKDQPPPVLTPMEEGTAVETKKFIREMKTWETGTDASKVSAKIPPGVAQAAVKAMKKEKAGPIQRVDTIEALAVETNFEEHPPASVARPITA